ncbi:hypothetical protein ETB97_001784 [Aspergillus alliaceus]|uniref:Uncharacterized protein n=1 Tax=Petromyces alliaceus TaxID=209559 RepID=A0A5N6FEL6_PETAA|nr:uncharacterized protein BDW43DRAFT_317162 [Aspergillus alliaceus]KAB8227084.1 hypothetical protein BDW43DRAFT_317162 [Aspergillus alliaceus]KAF5860250.1 hypothetical protein ETB97_001784 [Aspergillus burnettii]
MSPISGNSHSERPAQKRNWIVEVVRSPAPATRGAASRLRAQPVDFGVGILCRWIIADSAGWRGGFYSAAITNTFAFLLSWWQIPRRLVGGRFLAYAGVCY